MFKITGNPITSQIPGLQNFSERLPAAHAAAHESTVALAHGHLQEVARQEGWPPEGLVLHQAGADSAIRLAEGPAGDAVFNGEYGSDEAEPRPVLRGTLEALQPQLSAHYEAAVRQHLGL